ncbi:MAG: M23 family metallopeptidase [Ignavibacteria bacterium]|nr:M23 family metallopeptidase [Ignavibacteria bacterium]
MKKSVTRGFILFLLFPVIVFSQDIYLRWHYTDLLIRDRQITKKAATDSIRLYVELSVKDFKEKNYKSTPRKEWVFPMTGFTKINYREGGNDYRDDGFDYFQGGESKGHPAHDIFILDNNKDGIEDSTGEKVYAVAMSNGVVFSSYGDWKEGDFLRSGNYIKIFEPETEGMFYYSHLDSVFVKPGQFIRAGDFIGYVGRTGRKAIHGKTHIHIAYYKIKNGMPIPEDIIDDLRIAESRIERK